MYGMMERRRFIGLLGGSSITWPLITYAQQSPPVIGFIEQRSLAEALEEGDVGSLNNGAKARL
jgi:hypothetical protein